MTATLAQSFTTLAHIANRYAFLKSNGRTAGTNLMGLIAAQQILYYGDYQAAHGAGLNACISLYEQAMLNCRDEAAAVLNDIAAKFGAGPSNDVAGVLWPAIFQGMTDATTTVKYRNFTRDSGGPDFSFTGTGTGVLYRCTKDKNNQLRESGRGQALYAEVVADKNTVGVQSGQERLVLRGSKTGTPDLGPLRPGTINNFSLSLTAKRGADSYLLNSSFEDGGDEDASTTAITSWTAASGSFGTNIQRLAAAAPADSDTGCFRCAPGQTTGRALKLTAATCTLQQKFSVGNLGGKIRRDRPTLMRAVVRPSTGTAFQGTFQMRLGAKTVTLAHGAMASGWNEVIIAFDDDDSWPDVYKEDDVRCSVGLSAYTQGSLQVDEVVLCQGELYAGDGCFYVWCAGYTDHLIGDYLAITDTVADTGEIQTMLAELFGIYLPWTSGSATYADV